MDFLKGDGLEINTNYNFWRYSEVLELNKHAINNIRAEFVIEDGELMLEESTISKQRKKHKHLQRGGKTEQTPKHFY